MTPSYGLYADVSNVSVALPAADFEEGSTVLTFQGADAAKCINMIIGAALTAITFFAANNLTLALMGGSFWKAAGGVLQTVTSVDGSIRSATVPASAGEHVAVTLELGEYCRFAVKVATKATFARQVLISDNGRVALKTDDHQLCRGAAGNAAAARADLPGRLQAGNAGRALEAQNRRHQRCCTVALLGWLRPRHRRGHHDRQTARSARKSCTRPCRSSRCGLG